jgi:trimethylamine---corrinoid protein Co-methyltransferase
MITTKLKEKATVIKKMLSSKHQREGVLVRPYCRLSDAQVRLVDEVSRQLLENPGLLSSDDTVVKIFQKAGAMVEAEGSQVRIRIPSKVIDNALKTAPSKIVLGARNPENRLIIDANEPRVRFGSGAETNFWLEADYSNGRRELVRKNGSIELLGKTAHLAENLENLDFFIRCVNVQDEEINFANKDVNVFFTCLNNITKHVQAGITDIAAIDDVITMGQIAAGGSESFAKEPVLSFITCVIKSPLQFVNDTVLKVIEISQRNIPLVISSCAMAGTTGPFDEFGMVAQINAEVLAGVALNQIISPGAPVFYGAVPVRTRLDNLNDMYGTPEFNHYNLDCAQMARFYNLPCYSTVNACDATLPGIQATMEKMLTLMIVPQGGAQYIHYAFGLLGSNTFSPEQAILDNTHIGIVKRFFSEPNISVSHKKHVFETMREVMASDHRTFMYHLPLPSRDEVYTHYPFEQDDGDNLRAAHQRYEEIMDIPRTRLSDDVIKEICAKVKSILPQALS